MSKLKHLSAVLAALFVITPAHAVNPSYSTDWIANTYGLATTHVQNASRSLWVDQTTTGQLYLASIWDEDACGLEGYTNGKLSSCIGAHGESQGSALTANATWLWTPRQFTSHPAAPCSNNGCVYRYVRASGVNDQKIQVSEDTTERHADIITGMATFGNMWAASDHPGNRIRLYTVAGVHVRDITFTNPGALAFDRNGNILVANEVAGTVTQINQSGTILRTLTLPTGEAPHSLYFDPTTQFLWIGDAGPDQNAKVYDTRNYTLHNTFGVTGGYLDTTTGIKGQVGSLRFGRIDGIGKDATGNLYILSEPWGKTWDQGRTGGTNLYAYSPTGALLYNLLGLNFESIAAPDPATDATTFYSGVSIYTGTGDADWKYVANTVDPFTYPLDPRLDPNTNSRGEHFGQIADINGNLILSAAGQNPDSFNFYHFDKATSGYIAIPDGSIPGALFNDPSGHIRNGFCLDSKGGVWAGIDKTGVITYWSLAGFDANGKPSWNAPVTFPVPATLGVMSRIIYLPESDTLVLAARITGSTDWTSIGPRIEVYHGWMAGNHTNPVVITDDNTNPHSMTAAGNYLFVGYVHTVPNIDAYNLTTGTDDLTLTDSNPTVVYDGTDIDSMYGLRVVQRSNGEYVLVKDNYSATMIVVYRWTP